jgi:hypothetical protein
MENPLCPHCSKNIPVENIETKLIWGSKNTAKGNIFEQIFATTTKSISVVYICPNCKKILGFSN